MSDSPYISFIVVGRNDNYGEHFLDRFSLFVNNLVYLCERYRLPNEICIVEWNPPTDTKRLQEALAWPQIRRENTEIKIVEIPAKLHAELSYVYRRPMYEYIGKNVGLRRSRGEFLLVTNPDTVMNDRLIEFFSKKMLAADRFYRIDRCDVEVSFPFAYDQLANKAFFENKISSIFGRWARTEIGRPLQADFLKVYFKAFLRSLVVLPHRPPHTNAAGDFLLMPKANWLKLKGYPELEKQSNSHHIDSLMVYQAMFAGLKQNILKKPLRLFHVNHGRFEQIKVASPEVKKAFRRLVWLRRPLLFNDDGWGLGKCYLPETIIQ